jgi:aminocarboxymuconate-semialdehyde decarboxylase
MLLDVHAHVLPGVIPPASDVGDAESWPQMEPIAGDTARLLVSGRMRFTARDVFFDAERREEAMDANGVDAEVVSPMPPLLNVQLPATTYLELCRHTNEFVAGMVRSNPRRFFGLGIVPIADPDLAAAELPALKELGLHGVELASGVEGRSLGDERFLGFFQEVERLDLPVFVHGMPSPSDRLPMSAMGTFAVTTDIGLTAASLVVGGTAEKCPGLRVAFSHGGGGFPLGLPRAHYFYSGQWDEQPEVEGTPPPVPNQGPRSPFEYARRFWYDSMVFDQRALRYLVDLLGHERLLVGSDFPAMPRLQPGDRPLRSLGLPAEVLEDITWRNGFRFLGAKPPQP